LPLLITSSLLDLSFKENHKIFKHCYKQLFMAENEFARRTCSNGIGRSPGTPDVQYVDVKRIIPQNPWSIKVLQFYQDIQRIMNDSIGKQLDYQI
jgi:hypothetical protein